MRPTTMRMEMRRCYDRACVSEQGVDDQPTARWSWKGIGDFFRVRISRRLRELPSRQGELVRGLFSRELR